MTLLKRFRGAVRGANGVEVGQDCGPPAAHGPFKRGDLQDRASWERGQAPDDDPAAFLLGRGL